MQQSSAASDLLHLRCAKTFIRDKWEWVLQQIWPDVWSCECVNIIHRGTFIPGLALCPAQLSKAHTLSQTLSLDYHQRSCWPCPASLCPRSLLALWKQRVGVGCWGSNCPISMCQFGTQPKKHWGPVCGYFSAMSIALSPLQLLRGQILYSPNKWFLLLIKGVPPPRIRTSKMWLCYMTHEWPLQAFVR